MKKVLMPKRILNEALGLVLAFTTVFQLSGNLMAKTEKSDKAATIRLEKTEGTVTVENSSKGEKSLSDKMRLYDGDHEITDGSSYAWMSLDDTKMIKLDEESESEVRKKRKKLEVLLDSGSLFFNVTEPLDDDETLNIRTSTMIAGIRGTCGWVRVIDGLTTRLYLLEGRLDCLVSNPVDGSYKTITLKGGEYADFCVYRPDTIGDKCDILIDKFTREDIEGYVLIELVGDDETIQKIYDDSGIDLRDLTGDEASDRLRRSQEYSKNTRSKIGGDLEDQDRYISKDLVWDRSSDDTEIADLKDDEEDDTVVDDGDKEEKKDKQENTKPDNRNNTTNNDKTDSNTDTNNNNNTDENKDESVIYLTMPQTATTVQGYLDKDAVKKVVLLPGDGDNTLSVDIAFSIPANKTLEARDNVDLNVLGGKSMTVNGTADLQDNLSNSGTVTVNSSNTLKVKKVFKNTGLIENTSTGRIVLTGGLVSSGTIKTAGKIEASSGAAKNLITLNGGSFTITGGSIVSNVCDTLIKLGSGADVTFSLTGGTISNEKSGGEALNVTEGNFKLDSLGTDINGVSDSLLGTNVNYEKYGAGSVWRTDQRYHLVLLKDVESYPVAVAGNIEHGRLEVPSRVEVGAVVPIGVYPDDGYELETLTVNLYNTDTKAIGDAVEITSDHKFTMPKNNVIIGGSFKEKSKDSSEDEAVKYTVNFYSEDGKTLLYSNTFEKDTVPTYGGTTPTKAADAQYSYSFEGWTSGSVLYRSDAALASVTGNTDYTASFTNTPVPYALNFASTIKNGTVSAGASTAGYGTTVTLTVTPAANHKYVNGSLHVTDPDGNNISVTAGSNGQFTFTMPAKAVSVSAEFEYDGSYDLGAVWFADGGNVKFMIGDEYVTNANPGDVVYIDAVPKTGYAFNIAPEDRYASTGNNTSAVTIFYEVSVGKYRFDMPARDVMDIEVDFTYTGATAAYTISSMNVSPTGTAAQLLSIRGTPTTTQGSYYYPGTKMFFVENTTGYELKTLTVTDDSGENVPIHIDPSVPGRTRYFFMPNGDVTINAVFEQLYTAGITSAPSGTITQPGTYYKAGDTVTLSYAEASTTDEYELDDIKVTYSDNGVTTDIALTDNGDGTFSFVMPAALVSISAFSRANVDVSNISNLSTYFADTQVSEVNLAVSNSSGNFATINSAVTVPAGKILSIPTGTISNLKTAMTVEGTLKIKGVFLASSDISGSGTIIVENNGVLINSSVISTGNSQNQYRSATISPTRTVEGKYCYKGGECGSTAVFGIDSNGNCVVYGSGPIGNSFTLSTVKTSIKTLYIPDTITNLQGGNFSGCSNLEVVRMPESTKLYASLFSGCTKLRLIKLPDTQRVNTNNDFMDCTDLPKWYAFSNATTYVDQCEMQDTGITRVVLPDSVTRLARISFRGYSTTNTITTVVLGSGINSISDDAFENQNNIGMVFYNGSNTGGIDVSSNYVNAIRNKNNWKVIQTFDPTGSVQDLANTIQSANCARFESDYTIDSDFTLEKDTEPVVLVIASGATLSLASDFMAGANSIVINYGTIDCSSNISMASSAAIYNYGTITMESGSAMTVSGTMYNLGTLNIGAGAGVSVGGEENYIVNYNNIVNNGTFTVGDGSSSEKDNFANAGNVVNNGTMIMTGIYNSINVGNIESTGTYSAEDYHFRYNIGTINATE